MKLLNRLTIRNLQLNKKRTIVTVIGIMLSVALIAAVSTMFFSAKSSLTVFEKKQKGDYHYAFHNVKKQDLDAFLNNRKIEENYMVEELGFSRLEEGKNEYKPYANVKAFTKEGLEHLGVQLLSGRFPKNSSEILVPSHVKTNGRVEIKEGDQIQLELGERMVEGEVISRNVALNKDETLVNTEKQEFKVVGTIKRLSWEIENSDAAGYTFLTCKTAEEMGDTMDVYSRYTKEGMKEHSDVTAGILQVNKEVFQQINENVYRTEEEWLKLAENLGEPKYDYWSNSYLLTLESSFLENTQLKSLGMAVVVVILIIIATSVFCIKNSFDISISEKIRQYGMLASVGATKKQIRRNVYFEAILLGGMGIPAGIAAGLFASWILVHVCNHFIQDMLEMEMILDISWIVILLSVILGGVTILLSARRSAVRASKISPIYAIRSSEEIKIASNKIKAPKWVNKIFGIGGEISYKNLKRSRKKYRTTVISIVISVSVFIALFSFVDMAFEYVGKEFKRYDYNLSVAYNTSEISEEKIEKVKKLDGIKQYSSTMLGEFIMKKPEYNKEFQDYMNEIKAYSNHIMSVSVLDEPSFRAYAKKLNVEYEEVKGKGILFNKTYIYRYDEKEEQDREYEVDKYAYKKGDKILGEIPISYDEAGNVEQSRAAEIELAMITDKVPMGEPMAELILGPEYKEQFLEKLKRSYLYIDSQDAGKTQDEIEDVFGTESGNFYINNIEENAQMMMSLYTLLSIFLYGFIIVISLIGVTNIFNTITTNMSLRQREFAMLKSVGMTKKEFNRMIRLESFFYGMKSLVIGIPIGIILAYLLQCSMNNGKIVMQFVFPIQAIVISAGAVFLLIACIMGYSVRKIQKQNVIETIRKENI